MTDYKQLRAELVEAWDDLPWEWESDFKGTVAGIHSDLYDDIAVARARAALAESENHIGYPSYEQIQRFMFEVGFNIQDPDLEPAFPRAEYMKLAARIVDWTLTQ